MADTTPMKAATDGDWLPRVSEVSLRMMAGAIPRRTHERVQRLMAADAETYPWQQITESVLADAADPQALLERGLRAQRDWFARAAIPASARAGRAARVASKKLVAFVLSRAIFFVAYSLAVVALLVLARHHWPSADIYRILAWLREVAPGVFGR